MSETDVWPITIQDVLMAARRIHPYVLPTPLRPYPVLNASIGRNIRLLIKHENHHPTNSFKARNGMAAVSALTPEARSRGVVAATRGNHGLGLAWAGLLLGVRVVLCVPTGNNRDKNDAMRGFGATVVEEGADYDESVAVAERLVAEEGLTLIHSTNNAEVIAGAATLTLEMIAEQPEIDAIVVAIGGGSQAVGALTVVRALRPEVQVYGVQAVGAAAIHDSWHARKRLSHATADTMADGIATRNTYPFTFGPLLEGLTGFITVTEAEIAEAVRLFLKCTHNLAEPAGAAGLAGALALRHKLAGKTVAVILSGANIDEPTLLRIVNGDV